ncbi:MAG: alpha/beta fold hydrolase [Gammaproteobacteria bacterium]|nr:MAG: alpha/beta fold hydrolase [Gammaproteobacteria bacterium]
MRSLVYRILIFFFLLQPLSVLADILVLVHGYGANAASWAISGVNASLLNAGWQYGAIPSTQETGKQAPVNRFYAVELPATAPLMAQTNHLQAILQNIRQQHPDESLILTGHSAGGVVARLAVLGGNLANVSKLITIASPHLGTQRAIQSLEAVDDKPFFCPGPGVSMLKSMFGSSNYQYLRHSRGVLIDLLPPASGSLLDWANHQPHPDIEYHAVIKQPGMAPGDEMVPAYSQDMNQIPALRGKVSIWQTTTGHMLGPNDGVLLVAILNGANLNTEMN